MRLTAKDASVSARGSDVIPRCRMLLNVMGELAHGWTFELPPTSLVCRMGSSLSPETDEDSRQQGSVASS